MKIIIDVWEEYLIDLITSVTLLYMKTSKRVQTNDNHENNYWCLRGIFNRFNYVCYTAVHENI